MELNIPKIIHLTYKSDKIPKVWQNTIATWKKYHPDWQVMFWTDEDNRKLISELYPDFLKIFDSYEYGIQRADAIRYYILYTYGGLYSDMDITPTKSFNKLFEKKRSEEVYLIKSPQMGCITNCLMASKKGSKFWLSVFEEMKDRYRNPSTLWIGKHWKVMNTTGPMMLHKTYDSYDNKHEIYSLPKEFLLPNKCDICSNKPCKTGCGYTKLLEGSSWVNFDTKIYNFFLCNYGLIVTIILAYILIFCRGSLVF